MRNGINKSNKPEHFLLTFGRKKHNAGVIKLSLNIIPRRMRIPVQFPSESKQRNKKQARRSLSFPGDEHSKS